MLLFKEIDSHFTKKNAYKVLELYRRYIRIAGVEYAPKVTATYSFEPKSFSGKVNQATEMQVIQRVQAQNEADAIIKAINAIIDPYTRQVLIEKYCKWHVKSDKAIYMDLGYSESEFYRILERGAIEFAENYKSGKLLVFRKFGRHLQDN